MKRTKAARNVGCFDEGAFQASFVTADGCVHAVDELTGLLQVPWIGVYGPCDFAFTEPRVLVELRPTLAAVAWIEERCGSGAVKLDPSRPLSLWFAVHSFPRLSPCQHFRCGSSREVNLSLHAWLFAGRRPLFGGEEDAKETVLAGCFGDPIGVHEAHCDAADIPSESMRGLAFGALGPREVSLHGGSSLSPCNLHIALDDGAPFHSFLSVAVAASGGGHQVATLHVIPRDEAADAAFASSVSRCATTGELLAAAAEHFGAAAGFSSQLAQLFSTQEETMSVLLTLIARVPDGLMLCESAAAPLDDLGGAHSTPQKQPKQPATRQPPPHAAGGEDDEGTGAQQLALHRAQAKQVLRKLDERSPPRLAVEAGAGHFYAYVMRAPVCVLAVCARAYPRRLAFDFAAEVLREFETSHGADVARAARPYAFIAFDSFVRRTQRIYADERSRAAVERVAEDLRDAQRVMTQSIQDILERGEKISAVASRSEQLVSETSRYSRQARSFENAMWWRRRAPIFAAGGIALVLLVLRFFVF